MLRTRRGGSEPASAYAKPTALTCHLTVCTHSHTDSHTTIMASLLCTRTTCLRAAVRHGRAFAAPVAPIASFTSSARPLKQLRLSHEPTQSLPTVTARIPATCFALSRTSANRRHASTETMSPTIPQETLTWDRFFELRKKKRYLQLVTQIFTGAASFLIAAPLITEYEVDAYLAQLTGLDPVIMLGMTAVAVAVGGGMCGPTFSNAGLKMWAKSKGLDRAIAEVSSARCMAA